MTETDRIIDAVCAVTGVTRVQLLGDQRATKFARPRQLAYYLLSERTGQSLPRIGRRLNRDHTSVLLGIRRWRDLRADPAYASMESETLRMIEGAGDSTILLRTPIGIRVTTAAKRQRWVLNGPGDAALRILGAMHRLGHHCTVPQIADDQVMNPSNIRDYITRLLWTGHVKVERMGAGTAGKGGKQLLTAVLDVDGKPATPEHDARPKIPERQIVQETHKPARPPKRACNRCRNTFQPEHRFNFRCPSCADNLRQSAIMGAAPGMEFV